MNQLRIEAEIIESKKEEFEQSIHYIIHSKLKKYGGKNRRLFRDLNQPRIIKFTEEWDKLDDLKEYLKTDDFKCLIGAMNVLGDIRSAVILRANKVEDISAEIIE